MYKVIYISTLVMIGALLAGCAYCAFLMYMLTEGLMSIGWAICCVIWIGFTIYWIIDCLPKRRRKKAAQRRRTR